MYVSSYEKQANNLNIEKTRQQTEYNKYIDREVQDH